MESSMENRSALRTSYCRCDRKLKWIKLVEASGFKIHEVALPNGRSAVHRLAESPAGLKYNYSPQGLELMNYFLENPREKHCDEHGYTYLQAAWYKHEDVVEILLESGANPNQVDASALALVAVSVQPRVQPKILRQEKARRARGGHRGEKSSLASTWIRRGLC
ncbi:hypothetical protein TKK_0018488 [Trichogramma kaykai]